MSIRKDYLREVERSNMYQKDAFALTKSLEEILDQVITVFGLTDRYPNVSVEIPVGLVLGPNGWNPGTRTETKPGRILFRRDLAAAASAVSSTEALERILGVRDGDVA